MSTDNNDSTDLTPGSPTQSHLDPEQPVFTRVCRKCSAQATTSDEHCPACGANYVGGISSKSKKLLIIGATALIVVVGGGFAISAKVEADHQADVARTKAAEVAKARKAAEVEAAAQEELDSAQRKLRQSMVPEIEGALTAMAKKSVNDGILDGPIYSTTCDPVGGGTVDDLTEQTTKFECLVVNKKNSDGSSEGYKAHATMNWDAGTYQYGLGEG